MPDPRPRLAPRALFCLLAFAASATAANSLTASELRNSAIVKAVQDTEQAVVNIHGQKTVRAENASFGTQDAVRRVNGMGTGIIIDSRGYILTNYHVVEGVSNIQVTLADSKNAIARLISNDPKT